VLALSAYTGAVSEDNVLLPSLDIPCKTHLLFPDQDSGEHYESQDAGEHLVNRDLRYMQIVPLAIMLLYRVPIRMT
jgi:hypothetical protein